MKADKVTALILARKGSKRLPRKNITSFLGKPIISYPITAALQSGIIDELIVSTDSPEILSIATYYGAEDHPLRSAYVSGDEAPMRDAIEYELYKNIKSDTIVLLYATAVFTTPHQLRSAYLQNYIEDEKVNHLYTVKETKEKSAYTLLVDDLTREVKKKEPEKAEQDYSYQKEYHSAEQFEIFNREAFLRNDPEERKTTAYFFPSYKVVTINDHLDLIEAEKRYHQLKNL